MNGRAVNGRAGASRTASTRIMGVLNVTPDSFSDGGEYVDPEAALAHAKSMIARGATLIDVGGESTRPGADRVTPEEEQRRVLPVIRALSALGPGNAAGSAGAAGAAGAPDVAGVAGAAGSAGAAGVLNASAGIEISIDTVHASTARLAVEAGASIINDVSGGTADPEMYRVAAETGVGFVIMHWRGIPDPCHSRSDYGDVVSEVRGELDHLVKLALAAGVDPRQVILDPGLGFDKTAEQGWQLLANLDRLADLGYPLLIGVSRKRMLGDTLGEGSTMRDRDVATATVSALSARAGAWAVRVHDVAATDAALKVVGAWDDGASPGTERLAGSLPTTREIPRDRITLTGLEVFAHHGVFDFERENGQRFLIDAEIAVDLRAAAAGDDLARTVNYGELAAAILASAESEPVDLIETLAERLAGVALSFAGVREVRLTVHKPDAPIEAEFADVSVTIVRRPEPPL